MGGLLIYYWLRENAQIYLLLAYPKSEKDSLTDRETSVLRELVKELQTDLQPNPSPDGFPELLAQAARGNHQS